MRPILVILLQVYAEDFRLSIIHQPRQIWLPVPRCSRDVCSGGPIDGVDGEQHFTSPSTCNVNCVSHFDGERRRNPLHVAVRLPFPSTSLYGRNDHLARPASRDINVRSMYCNVSLAGECTESEITYDGKRAGRYPGFVNSRAAKREYMV